MSALPFGVPRPGSIPPACSIVEEITRSAERLSPRMQRRMVGLIDDIADAEARGDPILNINVVLGPKGDGDG